MLPGDQLEASSPADATFWPIHPTMERLWQRQKLARRFAVGGQDWFDAEAAAANRTTHFCRRGTCRGHRADDVAPFRVTARWRRVAAAAAASAGDRGDDDDDVAGGGERFTTRLATNRELYEVADPHHSDLPYVYENFEWTHCEALGYTL